MPGRAHIAALLFAFALLHGPAAHAHTPSVAQVHVAPDGTDGRRVAIEIDLSLKDLALTIPLDANRDEAVTWAELRAARDDIDALVLDGFALDAAGSRCELRTQGLATRRYDDGAYATVQLQGACARPGPYDVRYRIFADRDAQHRAMVTFESDGVATVGILRDATPTRVGAVAGTGTAAAREGQRSFVPFLREGVHHILIGYDHIAFLLSLVLPAMLIWTGARWRPADAVRPQLVQVFWLVTAFTLAHSVTLTLAALGWVRPASRVVEAVIAASVMLAALNNLRPVVTRRLWLLSLGFGLVHGFGFAGALGELGLPGDARFVALAGFNLGVELGQLLLLAVLMPLLVLGRGWKGYARFVLPAASWAIAGLAGWWLVERLAG